MGRNSAELPTLPPLGPPPLPWADAPSVTAAWLRRVSRALVIGIVLILATMGIWVAWVVSGAMASRAAWTMLASIAQAVSIWLLTCPEPGRRGWLQRLRWLCRLTMLGSAGGYVLLAARSFRPDALPMDTTTLSTITHACRTLAAISAAAGARYCELLARRLGDPTLGKHFRWMRILCIILLALAILPLLRALGISGGLLKPRPRSSSQATQTTEPSHTTQPSPTSWNARLPCFGLLVLPLSLWSFWMAWRLFRLLRTTGARLEAEYIQARGPPELL